MDRLSLLRWATPLLLICVCTVRADPKNRETLADSSQAAARAVLDRAVSALGGIDLLRSIDVVRVQVDGESWPRLQMATPAPPFVADDFHELVLLDTKNNRLRYKLDSKGSGLHTHSTTLIKGGEGTIYNHRAHTFRAFPSAPSVEQQFAPHYRRFPHLLLRQALDRESRCVLSGRRRSLANRTTSSHS